MIMLPVNVGHFVIKKYSPRWRQGGQLGPNVDCSTAQGPILLQRTDAVASLSANGSAVFKESRALSKKAALPFAKILAKASCRSCKTGPWLGDYSALNVCFTPDSKNGMGPTWGPPGSCRPQMDPMLPP